MTWEQLIEKYEHNDCNDKVFIDEKGYLVVGLLHFFSNGWLFLDNVVFATNRTPAQMHQIILALTDKGDNNE